MASASIAFEAPSLEKHGRMSSGSPIDLVHLAVQTMGDKALEDEILHLFARQARAALYEMASVEGKALADVAHRLKSAASAVGAFRVVRHAEALEADPADAAHLASLSAAVIEAENFILKLMR